MKERRACLITIITFILFTFVGTVYGQNTDQVSDSPAFQKQLESSLNGLNGDGSEETSDIVYIEGEGCGEGMICSVPRGPTHKTCDDTCKSTCEGHSTCDGNTCGSTCKDTCGGTCNNTCEGDTCSSTCDAACEAAEDAIDDAEQELEEAKNALEEAKESGNPEDIEKAKEELEKAKKDLEEAKENYEKVREEQEKNSGTNQNNQGTTNGNTGQGTTPTGGDPVRLATGSYSFYEKDMEYGFIDLDVGIERSYQSDQESSHSFGIGWRFNYDTRVIMGVKSRYEEEVWYIEGMAHETWEMYRKRVSEYEALVGKMNKAYEDGVRAVKVAGDAVEKAEEAVQKADRTGNSGYKRRAREILSQAQSVKAQAAAHLSIIITTREELFKSSIYIQAIYEKYQEIMGELDRSKREAAVARSNVSKNEYTINGTDPRNWVYTGNESLTLIDEGGVPHLYSIDTSPDYDSTVTYENGQINYYPSGSTCTASLPTDDTLRLLADGSYVVTKKDKTQYFYSLYGQVEEVMDSNGNKIRFSYSEAHELVRVEDDFERAVEIEREKGRITKITDPKGRTFIYSYEDDGRLVSRTDANGDAVRYEYQGHLLTGIIKPDGSSRQYFYTHLDGENVVDHYIDEEGNVEYFKYFPDQKYTEYINASGIKERYYYDRYLITKREYGDGSYEEMEYDEKNNLVRHVDELGREYRYSYDERRNLVEAIDPEGNRERWTYNEWNRVSSYNDKMGNTTSYSYDGRGNLVSISYPDLTSVTSVYNLRGQMIEYIDQLGNRTHYNYDENGYVETIEDAEGGKRRFRNDEIGNVIKYVDELGYETEYKYNLDNKIVRVTDPKGNQEQYFYNNRKDLIEVIDKNGNPTEFEYDKRHLLIKVRNAVEEEVEYQYRADGKMAEKVIKGRNHTKYEYDLRGNLIERHQVETGVRTRYEYDAGGQVTAVIDPNGNRFEYGYNGLGLVEWVKDPEGNTRFIAYNSNGKMVNETDELGRQTLYEYDEMGRLVEVIDPGNNSVEYGYDGRGNLIEVKDKNGNITKNEYDRVGRRIKEIDSLGNYEEMEYDPRGLVIEERDKRGNRTGYEYDSLGRRIRTIDVLGKTREYRYNAEGNLIQMRDEKGNETEFEYDGLSRMRVRRDGYGEETRYEYNELGMMTKLIDALGNETAYEYDELGRLRREIDPLGGTKEYKYDLNGNLIEERDELSRFTYYGYDSLGRLTKVRNGLGEEIGYRYDAVGNMVGEIDAEGREYVYKYDELDRLVREVNRLGNEQTYEYDGNGNLREKRDFNGEVIRYEYDELDRLRRVVFSDGTKKEYEYDAVGNIAMVENEDKQLFYAYDELNRLIQVEDQGSNQSIHYNYDSVGNRTRLSWLDGKRSITYTYGKANELLTVIDPEGKTTSFEYDPLLREVKRDEPNGVVTETEYDEVGRIITLRNRGGSKRRKQDIKSFGYLYNAAGERTYQLEEDGEITAYEYDELGRIKRIYYPLKSGKKREDLKEMMYLGLYPEHAHGGGDEWERGEGWRWQGGGEYVKRLEVDAEAEEALREAYEKIRRGRSYFDPRLWVWGEEFGYDERSNRVRKENGWGEIEYRYNEANEIERAGNREYEHDRNGNLILEAVGERAIEYEYNAENRIVEVTKEILRKRGEEGEKVLRRVVKYGYDGFGRRSERKEYWEGARKRRREYGEEYMYDGLGFNVLAEIGSSGIGEWEDDDGEDDDEDWGRKRNRERSITPVTEYIYGNGRMVSRTDFYEKKGWNGSSVLSEKRKAYYTHDILGSVVMVTESRGRVREEYGYDAYGNCYEGRFRLQSFENDWDEWFDDDHDGWGEDDDWDDWGDDSEGGFHRGNRYGYNGKRYDPVVGLYDYGYRDYKPVLGRFTTVDPILDGSNWYAYVENDPVNSIDLYGLEISVKVHKVKYGPVDTGRYHASIKITPENQEKYADDKHFKNIDPETGKKYSTLGAGPKFGKLYSKVNRDRDANLETTTEEIPIDLKGRNEDEVIEELFEKDSNYDDDLDYDLFPKSESVERLHDGYNSNSYARGLVESVGLDAPTPKAAQEGYMPGWDKPVESEYFKGK